MIRCYLLKVLFYISLTIVVLLIGYKVYLNLFESDFEVLYMEQVVCIHDMFFDDGGFSFVVVGNINNFVGVFEECMILVFN